MSIEEEQSVEEKRDGSNEGEHVPRGAETPVGPVHVEEVRHVPWGAETPIGPVHVEKVRHVPWGAETPIGPVHVENVHVVALLVWWR